jgi:beta-lactam-binding protein with PASTA domain
MSTVAAPTVRCPRCGTQQPRTLDFCVAIVDGETCLTYLGWTRDGEPSGTIGEQTTTSAIPDPRVQLTVESPGIDLPAPGALLVLSAMPGDRVALQVALRNVGTRVDWFDVTIEGLSPGWVDPAVSSLHLVPIGHPEGHSDGVLQLYLRPPRNSTAIAGSYPITIAVRSKTDQRVVACRKATFIVRPFFAVTATARPQIAKGRTKVRFWVDVRNSANTAIAPGLLPSDGEELTFAAPSGLTAIHPGEAVALSLDARAPRLVMGWPKDHPIQILVAVNGLEPPLPALPVIFRQKPLIPWWVPLALAILAALAIALYAVWPRKVTMPAIKGASTVFVAERRLVKAGFKGKPKVLTRVRSDVKIGTVIDQNPVPFARVSPDTPVTLRIAVPATYTIIPDLVGMTVGRAEEDLTRRYLKLGKVVPDGAEPSRKIASQIPLPGRARSRNVTAVDVVLEPPGKVRVSNIVCKTLGQIEKILTHAGLELVTPSSPVTSTQVATGQVPAAGVKRTLGTAVTPMGFKQDPASCKPKKKKSTKASSKSAKGSAATSIFASAVATDGEPVAFDDGDDVRLPPGSGPVATGQQPAWSPDGKLLAVRAGSGLRIATPGATRATPATVRVERDVLGAPAFSPSREGDPLLAFLAARADGSSRLCFTRVTSGALDASCMSLPRLRARSLAWSPGGKVILVVGARPGDAERPGVLRLRMTGAGPALASSWSVSRLLWRLRLGDRTGAIFDIAYDPRSPRLAVATSLGPAGAATGPQIALMDVAAWPSLRDAQWLAAPACQVAWSPTGARLAVVEAAGEGPCPAERGSGRLVTFSVRLPRAAKTVADGARNPAWRP